MDVKREVGWEALIDAYVDASNSRDIEALMALTDPGIAFYDAFWQETCVGRDFRLYMEDWFKIDSYFYSRLDPAIVTTNGAAFRYSAADRYQKNPHEAMYTGVEVLTQHAGKIVTISDFYADPSSEALEEATRVSAVRHGQPKYATHGFGTLQKSELRRRLRMMIEAGELRHDTYLTVRELAALLGCTPIQLIDLASGDPRSESESALQRQFDLAATEVLSKLF